MESVAQPISPWRAIWQVLWSPGETMVRLAERRPVLPVYIVLMLIILPATLYSVAATMDLQLEAARTAMAARGGASPADMEQMESLGRTMAYASAAVTGVAWPWVAGLVGALLMLMFGAFAGGSRPFTVYLSLYGYALIPGFLGRAIETLLKAQGTSMAAINQISMSAAALAPGTAPGGLAHMLLLALHPTALWTLFLALLGFAAAHRLPLRRTVGLGIALGLLVLGNAAIQSWGMAAAQRMGMGG